MKSLRVLAFLILGALMTSIIIALQRASGAYVAEFAATRTSEAGHVVSGLMMAEYFARGMPAPLAFVSDYALHFPAVVLGVWPPLFYVLEGLWVSALGPSTSAILLLPAVLAAFLMVSAGWATGRVLGPLPGGAVSVTLLALALMREATIVVGLDLPMALFALWAALAFSRFLASDGVRGAVPFALLASAAILTKGTAVLLLLLPLVAVVLCGRFHLLLRARLWLAYLIILILAGPWTIGTFPMVLAALPAPFGSSFIVHAAQAYGQGLVAGTSIILLVLALAGIVFAALEGARRKPGAEIMVSVAALAIAGAIVLCLIPLEIEPVSLLPLLAPVVMLAAYGLMRLAGLVVSGWPTIIGLLVALVLLLVGMPAILEPVNKPGNAMDEAAEAMLAARSGAFSVLVVSDTRGEAALVAAMAQQDQMIRSFVLPGSTVLAIAGRGPAEGAVLYPDAPDLMAGLTQIAPAFIVTDLPSDAREGTVQGVMARALKDFPQNFELLGRYPRGDGRGEAHLYALKGQDSAAQAPSTAPAGSPEPSAATASPEGAPSREGQSEEGASGEVTPEASAPQEPAARMPSPEAPVQEPSGAAAPGSRP